MQRSNACNVAAWQAVTRRVKSLFSAQEVHACILQGLSSPLNLVYYKHRLQIYSHLEITYTADYLQGGQTQSNTKASRRLDNCQGLNYINSSKSAHSTARWQHYACKTNTAKVSLSDAAPHASSVVMERFSAQRC